MPMRNRFDSFFECIIFKALFELKLIYQINDKFAYRHVIDLTGRLCASPENSFTNPFKFEDYVCCLRKKYVSQRKLKTWGRVPINAAGRWLKKRLGISDEGYAIYMLFAVINEDSGFRELTDINGRLSTTQFIKLCSTLLSIPVDSLKQELAPDSTLIRTGLARLVTEHTTFYNKFVTNSAISSMLLTPDSNSRDLLKNLVIPVPKSTLALADFEHVQTDLEAIVPFLKQAVTRRMAGCNILLYGSPGTGKTELARRLAKDCARCGYEVVYQSPFSEPLRGKDRLFRWKTASELLRNDNSILIMDEIEDTVPSDLHYRDESSVTKRWFNNVLENNPVCTIWISNSVKGMDPAFLRRFRYCLNVTIPGEEKRAELITKQLKKNSLTVDQSTVSNLAKQRRLSPAHINSAGEILSAIPSNKMTDDLAKRIYLNQLQAAGLVDQSILGTKAAAKHCDYYPEYSNASTSLEELATNLGRVSEGRYCLYGPAGTGKTGYVKYLSYRLKKRIVQKNASELLGKYIGQTEQAISRMFSEATRREAILLLDEADSFLTDRSSHVRSWETTLVNELLVQMEEFRGLFFCCTNRIENFDKAAARRFDFKIAFDYLQPRQIEGLFRNVLSIGESVAGAELETVKRLTNLTPADFEVAKRKARFSDHCISGPWLSEQLVAESEFRGDVKPRQIGFNRC